MLHNLCNQTQSADDKLNPVGLLLAALVLGCCLFCPMNKSVGSTQSNVIDYFDTFMVCIATLILFESYFSVVFHFATFDDMFVLICEILLKLIQLFNNFYYFLIIVSGFSILLNVNFSICSM